MAEDVDASSSNSSKSAEKSASAFRTIGEVSEELDIAQHVLRFWEEKFPQIAPVKRRGRRYYRPKDIMLLRQIKTMLHEQGITIKGVQRYLNSVISGKNLSIDGEMQPDMFPAAPLMLTTTRPPLRLVPPSPAPDSHSFLEDETLERMVATLSQARDVLRGCLAKGTISN